MDRGSGLVVTVAGLTASLETAKRYKEWDGHVISQMRIVATYQIVFHTVVFVGMIVMKHFSKHREIADHL